MSRYSQQIISDGAIAYWRLNELSGSSAADSSGNSHGGTYNSVTLAQAGLLAEKGYSGSFDGSTSNVNCPSLSIASSFSIEAWVYKTAAGGMTIVAQGDNPITFLSYFFRLGDTSGFSGSGGNISVPDPSLNVVHYHAITYDTATLRYYLDGLLSASLGSSGAPGASTHHTCIGQLGESPSEMLKGRIEEVAIYNKTLSAATIARHFALGTVAGLAANPVGNCPLIRGRAA